MNAASVHVPVLLHEVLAHLQPRSGAVILDGTLGGGGHARALADCVTPGGRVIGLDLDPAAIARSTESLAGLPVEVACASYAEAPAVLRDVGVTAVDGILLDLGLSSDQLADADRGFSYQAAGDLDLRFDAERGQPAWRLLQVLREKELADLIYRYGEERYSRRIARRIVEHREQALIRSASELADLVRSCVPRSRGHKIDPATRTFQALRIAVNDELGTLETALACLPNCLKPGGRLAIISFHSLEDRIVKHAFRGDARLETVTRRPVQARETEVAHNPRSRSAKLRVAQRRPDKAD